MRFDWGPNGLRTLAPGARAVVVVDVLRFTTAVSVAVSRGAVVLPYRWHDGEEATYAEQNDAVLPGPAGLSPAAMLELEPGARLVVPSPNGSALSFGVADHEPHARVFAGCLRDRTAVANAVHSVDGAGHVAVIAAGERWSTRRTGTGPLRPCLEDLLGAGAVLDALGDVDLSPEARAARAAFRDAAGGLADVLVTCASGRELAEKGWGHDVPLAAALDADGAAPVLSGVAFGASGSASPDV